MEKYYSDDLFKQFLKINGIKTRGLKFEDVEEEYYMWAYEMKKIGEEKYTKFLDSMGLIFKNQACVEVGKCGLDSVVSKLDTKVITKDPSSFEIGMQSRIIGNNLYVKKDEAIVTSLNNENYKLSDSSIYVIMTQNPYNNELIKNFSNLHNSGNYGIIVGGYGFIDDKNTETIKMLKKLKEKLSCGYTINYETDGNIWFFAVGSKPFIKTKILYKK